MKAGPPGEPQHQAGGGLPWGAILRLLAIIAFIYALHRTRSPMVLVNAGLATAIALTYAAQQEQGLGRRGAVGWCICFGLWAATLFGLLLPRLWLPPAPPGAAAGPGALMAALIILIFHGGIVFLGMWPYARRVVGLAERPLWADEQPALHLGVVTLLVLFTLGAIARLVGMIGAA